MNDNPRNLLAPNRSNTLSDADYPLAYRMEGISVDNVHAKLPDGMFILSGAINPDSAQTQQGVASPVPDTHDRIRLVRYGQDPEPNRYRPEVLVEAYAHAGEVVMVRCDGHTERHPDITTALDALYGIAIAFCPEEAETIERARDAERQKRDVLLDILAMDGMEAIGKRGAFAISDVRQTLAQAGNVHVTRTLFGGDGPMASQQTGGTTAVLAILKPASNGKLRLITGAAGGKVFSRDYTAWRALLRQAAAAATGLSGHERAALASLAISHPLVKGKRRFAEVFGDPQIDLFQTIVV